MGFGEIVAGLILGIIGGMVANEIGDWSNQISRWFLWLAVKHLSHDLQDRYEEEWLAYLQETPGRLTRVMQAAGLIWGAIRIEHERRMPHTLPISAAAVRLFDLLIAMLMIYFCAPIMLIAALALLIESGGKEPIFFKQVRVGRDGKHFYFFKFRTVVIQPGQGQVGYEITKVGRVIRQFRVDELPNLYNVLRGDMSFVGPYPERPSMADVLEKKIEGFRERYRVRPGIISLAAVNLHTFYATPDLEIYARERLRYELEGIKNFGIVFTIKIILRAFVVILFQHTKRNN